MSCQHFRFQIVSLVDGSLDSKESSLREHLSVCSACSEFQQEQIELNLLLGSSDLQIELPAGIWCSISEQIENHPQHSHRSLAERLRAWFAVQNRGFAPTYGLAGLAAMLLLSVSLFRLPAGPNPALLAQLDNYTFERAQQGNPFLERNRGNNPFLSSDFRTSRGNPFAVLGRRP